MNRRLALLLGVLVASGAAFVLVPTARLKPQRAVRIFDRRCRGGCTDSALLRVLPGGAVPSQYATGQLSGSNGQAVTTTRASTKTCNAGTLAAPSLVTLSSNLPCVESQGLLVEGAGTNLALWSQALDNAAWTKSGTGIAAPTVTADQAVAPDGTLTADRIDVPVNSSSANRSIVFQTFTTAAAPFTCSAYFKGVSGSGTIYLAASDGTAGAGTTTTACAFTSTAWSRCSAPRLAGNYTYCTIGVDPTLGTALPVPASTPAISVYAWGEDGEAQQFATSYIATNGSTAPRAAETDAVANPLPNSGAAWCVYETVTPEGGAAWSAPSTSAAWGLGTYSFANSAFSQARGDSNVYTWTNGASGGAWYGFASNAFSAGSSHRLGQCVSGTTVTEYFDGVAMSVTQGGTPVAMTGQSGNLYIGSVSSGLQIYGYVSDVCVGGVGACR